MLKVVKKYSIICLSIVVFLPAVVQLLHTFEKHEHGFCISKDDQHFHQKDLDCALCHLQNETYAVINDRELPIFHVKEQILLSTQYNFLSNYQQLSFSLRGPPSFI